MKRISLLLSLMILFSCDGQSEKNKQMENNISEQEISDISEGKKVTLLKINCDEAEDKNGNYKVDCKDVSISSSSFEFKGDFFEFITIKFEDIEKSILRKIGNTELLTSSPYVYHNSQDSSYVFFFPLIAESHFGWKLYYYKDYVMYPLGQRVTYWNPEYEGSGVHYDDFLKIYQSEDKISVAIPSQYIVKSDEEYQNYPDFLEGDFYEKESIYYFNFPYLEIDYYKKYSNGIYEGDYIKMINNKIIEPFQ